MEIKNRFQPVAVTGASGASVAILENRKGEEQSVGPIVERWNELRSAREASLRETRLGYSVPCSLGRVLLLEVMDNMLRVVAA
jgi:hypothetical protein